MNASRTLVFGSETVPRLWLVRNAVASKAMAAKRKEPQAQTELPPAEQLRHCAIKSEADDNSPPLAKAVKAGRKLADQIKMICTILEGGEYPDQHAKLIRRIEDARKAFEGLAHSRSDKERGLHCVRFLDLLHDLATKGERTEGETDRVVAMIAWNLFANQAPQYWRVPRGTLDDTATIVRLYRENRGGLDNFAKIKVSDATTALCTRLGWPDTEVARSKARTRYRKKDT